MKPSLPLIAVLLATLGTSHSAFAKQPSILFIYADDWGWGDLACHGHPVLKTPNLDRLAREGTDFYQFTVCNPVCSPSRTAIVTGQYPARHSIHEAISDHDSNESRGMPDWLDPKVVTLPRLLKQAGYTTGHFGKWHLGGRNDESEAPKAGGLRLRRLGRVGRRRPRRLDRQFFRQTGQRRL